MYGYQPKGPPLSLGALPDPPSGGSGVQPLKTERELRDEVQALRRQVRELQHERDGWKRKHQSLQAAVRVFLRRMRDGQDVTDEELRKLALGK